MGSILANAIADCDQEIENLKWWIEMRRYNATASKTASVMTPSWSWLATYTFHGEGVDGRGQRCRFPSPEDIEYACHCIKAERGNDWVGLYDEESIGPDVIKEYRDPRITTRYMPSEFESQLCDCPYWGTEFS